MIKLTKILSKERKLYFSEEFRTKGYLSLLKYIDGVIGNSSSGISEVPLFSTTSINLVMARKDNRLQLFHVNLKKKIF